MTPNYTADEADLRLEGRQIEALWAQNLAGYDLASAEEKMRLGYLDNPAGYGVVVRLCSAGDAAIQGAQGLHQRRLHWGQEVIRANGLADFVVNLRHRSLGPALLLMRRSAQIGAEKFDLTYSIPNAKAAAVVARAGLKRLGLVGRYARPICSRQLLARKLPGWLLPLCAPLVDQVLGLQLRLMQLGAGSTWVCQPAPWDAPALDELWQQRPDNLLLSERRGQMLRWRFAAPGRAAWQLCLARDAQNKVRGYVVWRNRDGAAEVGDFFASTPDTLTKPLMLSFSRFASTLSVRSISVEFFGAPKIARQLQGAGFHLRPEQAPVFIGATAAAAIQAPDIWYCTLFDNDAD